MSAPVPSRPAKLLVGFFLAHQNLAGTIMERLEDLFGPIDLVSRWLPFDYTDYYTREMGTPLYRRMVAFKDLVNQENLPDIKHLTNAIEADYVRHGRRVVNIDPGYLLLERLVLATGKNFSHRIYLRRGIYADLTLIFQKKSFRPLKWTYPDYAGSEVIGFFGGVRERYMKQLREARAVINGNQAAS